MIKKLARIARAITVPPIMVFALLMLLYFGKDDAFASVGELICAIVFLMVIPLLAYPIAYFVPSIRAKGQKGKRTLAFVLSLVGYTAGLIYALILDLSHYQLLLFMTYFFSIVILIIINKVIKVRASGHACSTAGPLTMYIYVLGIKSVIFCLIVYALAVWSSLALKRHTVSELVFGSLTSIAAFFISLLIIVLV